MTTFARHLLVLGACLLAVAAFAQQGGFRTINQEAPAVEGPVEVIEFFWYGCGACYQFAPLVDGWKSDLDDGVSFRRVPAVLNPRWRTHGQAFYTAEALGVTDQLHAEIFRSIHEQRRFLESQDEVRALFVHHGVDAAEFDAAWGSFGVDSQLRRAESLAREYQVRATPSIVVAGRYVSDPSTAGGLRELLSLTDTLVDRMRGE